MCAQLSSQTPNNTAAQTDKAIPLHSQFENEFTLSETKIRIRHRTTEKNVGLEAFEAQESASS